MLAASKRTLVFSGAGLSRASGIPTYRDDNEGLWTKPENARFSHISALQQFPKETRAFWKERKQALGLAEPNAGHLALAELQRLRPNTLLVTQNVDGLLTRAGCHDVVELHGNIHNERCGASPEHKHLIAGRCVRCGGKARPDIILFGEMLNADLVNGVFNQIPSVDLLLVVGTSAQVFPAADIVPRAGRFGAKVIVVDPSPPPELFTALHLRSGAEDVLPQLIDFVPSARE